MQTDSPRSLALANFMEHEYCNLLTMILKREAVQFGLSRVEVEDAIGDVVAKLLSETGKALDTSRSIAGLVRYRVRKLFLDQIRQQKSRPAVVPFDEGLELLVGVSGIRVLSDTHEWQIRHHLSEAALADIVSQLSPSEKVLLVMRVDEAAEHAEIGRAIGKSAEAARKDWTRLRDRLRNAVSEQLIQLGWKRFGQTPTEQDLELIDRWFSPDCTADEAAALHVRIRTSEQFSRLFGEELLVRMVASVASVS